MIYYEVNKTVVINGKEYTYIKGKCKSTDTKPTTGICNASELYEINTGKFYIFDAETMTWLEQ